MATTLASSSASKNNRLDTWHLPRGASPTSLDVVEVPATYARAVERADAQSGYAKLATERDITAEKAIARRRRPSWADE